LKISAIITTYNSAKYIRRTIDSILNQDRKGKDFEMEIIVVDDRSTDETARIIQEEYKDIKLVQNEINSGGPNKGRNIGL
jgi:glycosyltransferase involved in cell wall biosynthesis